MFSVLDICNVTLSEKICNVRIDHSLKISAPSTHLDEIKLPAYYGDLLVRPTLHIK